MIANISENVAIYNETFFIQNEFFCKKISQKNLCELTLESNEEYFFDSIFNEITTLMSKKYDLYHNDFFKLQAKNYNIAVFGVRKFLNEVDLDYKRKLYNKHFYTLKKINTMLCFFKKEKFFIQSKHNISHIFNDIKKDIDLYDYNATKSINKDSNSSFCCNHTCIVKNSNLSPKFTYLRSARSMTSNNKAPIYFPLSKTFSNIHRASIE